MPQQTFHDEPFIIDNGPLMIDVGERHAESHLSRDGDDWLREHTAVDSVLVLRKNSNAVDALSIKKLERDTVTIALSAFKTKPPTRDATLELRWETGEKSVPVLRFKPTDFRLEKEEPTGTSRRLRQPAGSGLRILKIEGGGLDPITFDGRSESIFVVFYAS